MKIIIINGQGGCGKDSFVGYCGYEDEGVYSVSMVDGIKRIAEQLGWRGGKEPDDRKFLSDLKDLAALYSDFPFRQTLKKIKDIVNNYKWYSDNSNELICFVHARELEDIDRFVYDYGARALLIRRPKIEGEYGNHADDNVFEVEYDYEVWNDGDLYLLKDRAEKFVAQIRNEDWSSWV